MGLRVVHLVAGQHQEDPLGVGREGSEDVGDGGELEAAAGLHHHALPGRLLAVRQEVGRVEPDKVEPKQDKGYMKPYSS